MATHPSLLAWRIPWTEVPGGLQSMGWRGVGRDWATNTFHTLTDSLDVFGFLSRGKIGHPRPGRSWVSVWVWGTFVNTQEAQWGTNLLQMAKLGAKYDSEWLLLSFCEKLKRQGFSLMTDLFTSPLKHRFTTPSLLPWESIKISKIIGRRGYNEFDLLKSWPC